MFTVAWGIGNLAQVIGAAIEIDDDDAVRRVGSRLQAARQQLDAWARRAGAHYIADLGSAGLLTIDPDHDEVLGLADVVDQLSDYLGSLQLSFGVGMTPAEAWIALRRAAAAGEPYCLYDPNQQDPDEVEGSLSAALLDKGEKVVEPKKDGDQSKAKQQVREALQRIKEQAPIFEALKQQSPEAYDAVQRVVMAMVLMATELAGSVEKAEELAKKLQLPARTPVKQKIPAAEANPGSDSGAQNLVDEKKSLPTDPLTGLPLKTKWHSVRSGKIVGKKGGIVPSRQPNQD